MTTSDQFVDDLLQILADLGFAVSDDPEVIEQLRLRIKVLRQVDRLRLPRVAPKATTIAGLAK